MAYGGLNEARGAGQRDGATSVDGRWSMVSLPSCPIEGQMKENAGGAGVSLPMTYGIGGGRSGGLFRTGEQVERAVEESN
jgi:hypothetical protein